MTGRSTISALGLALVAAPALAHEGGHLHPHGAESWLLLLPAVALLAVAALGARVGR